MDSEEKDKGALSPEQKVFEDLLDLAVLVREAREQADEAADKAHLVEELCRKAHAEEANIKKVAEDLTSTAVGVAKIALSINKYQTFNEAYKAHPEFRKKIPLGELTELLSEPNKEYDSTHSEKMVDIWSKSTEESTKDKIDSDSFVRKLIHAAAKEQRRPSLPYSLESNLRYRKDSQEEYPKHHSLPDRFHTKGDPSYKPQPNYNQDILKELGEKKVEKFTEKFPLNDLSPEGKASLVETFDSKASLRTVWENGAETTMRPLITGGKNIGKTPESWAEKKMMQKMKLKLPKESGERLVTENTEGQNALTEPFDKSPGYFKSVVQQQTAKENEASESTDAELESIMFEINAAPGRPTSASKQIQLIRTEMTSSNDTSSPWGLPARNRNNPRPISPLVVQEQDNILVLSDDESQRQTTVVHHTMAPVAGAISPLRPLSPRQP